MKQQLWLFGTCLSLLLQSPSPAQTTEHPRPSAGTGSALQAQALPGMPPGAMMQPQPVTPPGPSPAAQALVQTHAAYRANPQPVYFGEMMRAVRAVIAESGRAPVSAILHAHPALADLGAKVHDASGIRVWTFSRSGGPNEAVVQWTEVKKHVTYTGRRRRIPHVTTTSTSHQQSILLPMNIAVKDARIVSAAEGPKTLIIVGDENGSSLALRAYRFVNGVFQEDPEHFRGIPDFLSNNISGKVAFRGNDLIFMVARVFEGKNPDDSKPSKLPETESSTYRFWLRYTDSGYVLDARMPNQDHFSVVKAFLNAYFQNHTDAAKAILSDPKLISIPRYVDLKPPTAAFRVAEMANPGNGTYRFRLVTNGRNDLIFDVGRFRDRGAPKDRPAIRALFIAAPDPFLQDLSKHLPLYDTIANAPAAQAAPEENGAKH